MIISIGTVEVSTTLVGIACLLVKALHTVNIREDGVGELDACPASVPETHHSVAVATISHTRCGSQFVSEVVHDATTGVSLCIQAYISHEIN